MPIKELLKTMFHSFFVITTGVTMAMYISCRLLYPDTVLSVGDIGGILLLALFCDLSFLIFASGKELGKKQMAVRFCIHIPLEVAIVLFFASKWDWVNIDKDVYKRQILNGIVCFVNSIVYFRKKEV